jgi:PAS domain S-box-containing protein
MKRSVKHRVKTARPLRSPMARIHVNPAALDMLPIGVLSLDHQLHILSVNAEAARLLGRSADFCSSKPLQDLLLQRPGTSDHNVMTRIQASVSDRCPIQETQTTLVGPVGEPHPVAWSYVPLSIEEGSGGVLTIRDLTREKELQQDYTRLARVAEESPSPIIELNSDANLVYANPAMTRLLQRFGYNCRRISRCLSRRAAPARSTLPRIGTGHTGGRSLPRRGELLVDFLPGFLASIGPRLRGRYDRRPNGAHGAA